MTEKRDVTALPLCPEHGPVEAVFWHGALVCPDSDCHRTCAPPDARRVILAEINAERDRQDKKWGGVPGTDRRDDHTYAAVLGEEFGESCKAWIERDAEALRAELIQTAAVAIAWVEELDNGGMRTRG